MSYILSSGKLWQRYQTPLFTGFSPAGEVPTGQPYMRWTGGKISLAVWQQVLAFFLEYRTNEVQVRLYYNTQTRDWAAHAFPQKYPTGMTTSEIEDHPNMSVDLALFPQPWAYMGTVHHHCGAGAFQSGTDHGNEATIVGIHITVGKLNDAILDIHSRLSMKFVGEMADNGDVIRPGTQHFYESPDLTDWFQLPQPVLDLLPASSHGAILHTLLRTPVGKEVGYPARWSENLIRFQQQAHTYDYESEWPAYRGGPIGFGSVHQPGNHGNRQFGAKWDHEHPQGAQSNNGSGKPHEVPSPKAPTLLAGDASDDEWTYANVIARMEPVLGGPDGNQVVGHDIELRTAYMDLEFASEYFAGVALTKMGFAKTVEGTYCHSTELNDVNNAYLAIRERMAAIPHH